MTLITIKLIILFLHTLNVNCARRFGDRRLSSVSSSAETTDDCATSLDDTNSIICRSLISCSNEQFYKKFTRIIFDLDSSPFKLDKNQFSNCLISQSRQLEIVFKNVQHVKPFSFHQFELESNSRLVLKFDGGNSKKDNNQLIFNKNALRAFHLNQNSQLVVEILNYKSVQLNDVLVQQDNSALLQDKNSNLQVNIHDCDYVLITPQQTQMEDLSQDIKVDEQVVQTHDLYDHNKTYSLQILHVDQIRIDQGVLTGLQIMPYSSVSIEIRSAYSCSLGDQAFERLMIGTSARFNFLIQNVNLASLGKLLFNRLQQSAMSSFYFQMDQIGSKLRRKKRNLDEIEKLNPYYEEEEEDDDTAYDEDEYQTEDQQQQITTIKSQIEDQDITFEDWFCVPEFMFKNVEQSESAIAQMHFTRFQMSISVSSLAFSEFQLSENSKFQIMLQDVRGHIFMDSKSIDLIRLSDGIFELWIENHKQLVNDKGNRFKTKLIKQQTSSLIKQMKKTKNTYLKLNDLAFNKIFLSSRSLLRIGFVNSDSVFVVSPKALNGFHLDEMTTQTQQNDDYRTRISLEIKQSENLHFEFVTQQDLVTNDEDLSHYPRLVEIDGYVPIMSDLSDSKSFAQSEVNLRQLEFCRFFKLRPLIAQFKFKLANSVYNSNNLVYFSEPIKFKNETNKCTSCLFMYLYRTLHRRHDFYYLKDYLPHCFINLHYGNNLYLIYKRDSIKTIENTFTKYWSQLNCEKITGFNQLFQYNIYSTSSDATESILDPKQADYIGDETLNDFERISKHCNKVQDNLNSVFSRNDDEIRSIVRMSQDKWHETALRICTKNLFDTQLNNSKIKISFKKEITTKMSSKSQFSWSLFFAFFFIFSTVTILIGFVYLKYKKSHSNLISSCLYNVRSRLDTNKFEQLNNETLSESIKQQKVTNVVSYNKLVKNDHKLQNDEDDEEDENREEIHFDELNAYEYDDEFGLSNHQDTNQVQFKPEPIYSETTVKLTNQTFSSRLKQFKLNLLTNKNNLLKLPLFQNMSASSSTPGYSYKSTDSTLHQINQQNNNDESNLEIVYDITTKIAKPNLIKSASSSSSNANSSQQDAAAKMNLNTNPLDTYLELNNIKTNSNESEA